MPLGVQHCPNTKALPGMPRWHCLDQGYLVSIMCDLERQFSRLGKKRMNSGVRLPKFKLGASLCLSFFNGKMDIIVARPSWHSYEDLWRWYMYMAQFQAHDEPFIILSIECLLSSSVLPESGASVNTTMLWSSYNYLYVIEKTQGCSITILYTLLVVS